MVFESPEQTDIYDNVNFSNEGGEHQHQLLNIKDIVLKHLRKIGDICCKEFVGGYWTKKPVNIQGGVLFLESYHEDVREAYCNAIDFLSDILYPLADEDFRGYIDEVEGIIELDIKKKVVNKRKTFKAINMMLERINFFGNG